MPYKSPTWVNEAEPAISAENLQSITDAVEGSSVAPINVQVTFPTSGWTSSGGNRVQTVACAGLLASDGYNARVSMVGSTDFNANALMAAAYDMVRRWACNANGQLTATVPGTSAPTTAFTVNVCIVRGQAVGA